jgi:membrane-associated protease RseP (regulator of RpoE activity)
MSNMSKKKISPKVHQSAERYLASLDSSRELLTNEQWDIIVNYVKAQRMKVPILLILGVIQLCLAFIYFQRTNKYIASIIPLTQDYIKKSVEYIRDGYFMTGSLFVLAVSSFTFVLLVPIVRGWNKRMLKPFIPHKQELKTISPADNLTMSD